MDASTDGRPARRHGNAMPWLVGLFCVLLLAILWAALAYQLSFERTEAIRRREIENDNLVRLFEEHVQRTLAAASITLKQLESEYRLRGARMDLDAYFESRRDELAPYSGLSVLDANGSMVLSTTPLSQGQNYRGVENFRFHQANSSQSIFIAKPRTGMVTRRTTVFLTRRMSGPDGRFMGTTGLSMNPDYFSGYYDQIDLGPGSLVLLVGRDGVVRARKSDATPLDLASIQDMTRTPLFTTQLPQSESGHFRGTSPVDGIERLISYRTVDNQPLIVIVGTSMAVALQGYEQRRNILVGSAAGISLLVAAFFALISMQWFRRGRILEALHESEERYALVEGVTHDGIWDKNIATGRNYLSVRGKAILGYARDELEDRVDRYLELVHPDDRELVAVTQARIALDGGRHQAEIRMRHKDGGYRWLLVRAGLVRDAGGRPSRLLGSVTDITDRKKAEQHIQRQARLLDLLFSHSQHNIALMDSNFHYLRVSESYAMASGREASWFPGKYFFRIPSGFQAEIESVLREKKVYSRLARPFRFSERPEIGRTYWDMYIVPILDRAGEIEYFLLASRDVTERVQAERSVAVSVERIRALSRRVVAVQEEERQRIARELHDEIGQGLTAVKIRLQAMGLSGGAQDNDRSRDNLAQALDAVTRTLEQVRSLSLDLRPMQLDDLGLSVALSSLVNRDAAAAGWNVSFRESLGRLHLNADIELTCYRVVQEALTNVMRHAAATEVRVSLRREADRVLLRVRDNGHGFDMAAARAATEGRHLGLLGMEERVNSVGGVLDIRSRPGRGTTITASFTIETTQEAKRATA